MISTSDPLVGICISWTIGGKRENTYYIPSYWGCGRSCWYTRDNINKALEQLALIAPLVHSRIKESPLNISRSPWAPKGREGASKYAYTGYPIRCLTASSTTALHLISSSKCGLVVYTCTLLRMQDALGQLEVEQVACNDYHLWSSLTSGLVNW